MKKLTIFFWMAILLAICANGLWAQMSDKRTLVAPQFAVGWEGTPRQPGSTQYVTDIQIVANSFASGKDILFSFVKSDGGPMIVDLVGPGGARITNVSNETISVQGHTSGGATVTVCTSCGSQSTQVGAIIFLVPYTWSPGSYNYDDDVAITVVYRRLDWQGNEMASAGVDIKPFMTKFTVPVIITPKVDTGFAIYNPSSGTATLTLNLFNTWRSSGDPASPLSTAKITLKPNEQQALFFSQAFKNVKSDVNDNMASNGHVEITSDVAIAVTALKCFFPSNGAFIFAGIPIFPLK